MKPLDCNTTDRNIYKVYNFGSTINYKYQNTGKINYRDTRGLGFNLRIELYETRMPRFKVVKRELVFNTTLHC